MSMKYPEILEQKLGQETRGNNFIPGTNKVRTYCGNASLYTRESCVERMRNGRYRPIKPQK